MTVNSIAKVQMGDALMKLSTMQRINSAADDAAGLAIAEKLQSQITGLDQGSRNTLDMQNLIKTAEGALSTIDDSLQRVRELSLQAANGIYTDDDKALIQQEIGQMLDHANTVAGTAQFNTMNLLDGTFVNKQTASDAAGRGAVISLPDMGVLALGLKDYDVTRSGAAANDARTNALRESLNAANNDLRDAQAYLEGPALEAYAEGVKTFTGAEARFNQQTDEYDAAREQLNTAMSNANITNVNQLNDAQITVGSGQYAGTEQAAALITAVQRYANASEALGLDEAGLSKVIGSLDADRWGIAGNDLSNTVGSITQAPNPGTGLADYRQAQTDFAASQLSYQTALNARDTAMSRADAVSGMLNASANAAGSDLDRIDNALAQVSSARAYLGAMSNRMDYTVNSNSITMLNQAAARSRVMDLDVAKAASDLSRENIITQYQIQAQKMRQEQQQQALSVIL
jgi:flagellin